MAKAKREEEFVVRWMLLKTDAEGEPAVVDRRPFSVQITGGPVTVYGRVSSADDFVPLSDRRGVRLQEVTTGLYYVDTPLHAVQPMATETATVALALARNLMGVVPWTPVTNPEEGSAGLVFKWAGMNANDCGQALAVLKYTDNSFQIFGTGPITMRGSLKKAGRVGDADVANPASASDWTTLTDYDGTTAATLTTSGTAMALKQNTTTLSPLAGGGVAAVDVYVLVGSSR